MWRSCCVMVVNREVYFNAFSNRSSEIADVKGDKCVFFLFRYIFKPFYGIFGTFPQVHFSRLCSFVAYSVEDVFAAWWYQCRICIDKWVCRSGYLWNQVCGLLALWMSLWELTLQCSLQVAVFLWLSCLLKWSCPAKKAVKKQCFYNRLICAKTAFLHKKSSIFTTG